MSEHHIWFLRREKVRRETWTRAVEFKSCAFPDAPTARGLLASGRRAAAHPGACRMLCFQQSLVPVQPDAEGRSQCKAVQMLFIALAPRRMRVQLK